MNLFKKFFALFLAFSLSFAAHPLTAQAATQYNQKVAFQSTFQSCSGEQVVMSGYQHIVGRVTIDATGQYHFGFTRNLRATGVGSVSGDNYAMNDTVALSISGFTPGKAQTFNDEYHSRFIHQGETGSPDDGMIHMRTHITFDANGRMTTSVDVMEVTCK